MSEFHPAADAADAAAQDRQQQRIGQQHRIASFADYLDAQRLVDRMSDDGFPVEHVRIVGDGVRIVEQSPGG